jgi:hypothetical protein
MSAYTDFIAKKNSIGTDSPTDMLASQVSTPEVDFSQPTLQGQMGKPQAGLLQQPVDFKKDTLAEQAAPVQEVGGESAVGAAGGNTALKSGGAAGAATLAQGGSATDAVASGLVASGNPYAMGAGLALMTASSIQKKKQAQKNAKYEAAVKQADQRREAITNMAQIGQNLKA